MDPKLNRVIIKVIAAALTIVGLASAQTQYTMKRLAFSGGLSSTSTAINRAGQVIGLADNGSAQRGFFYDGAVMHDLGALPGGTRATPKALNNKGWVVGLSDVGGSTIPHVFLYQPPPDGSGLLQDLGTFGGSLLITPVGITDSGRIAVGVYDYTGPLCHAVVGEPPHQVPGSCDYTFVWEGGTVTGLPSTANIASVDPVGINQAGQVAANCAEVDPCGNTTRGCIWSGGAGMSTISDLSGGCGTGASAVNSFGVMGGTANLGSGFSAHAIVSPGGAAQDLGSLGYNYSTAKAINNNNDVIGYVLNSRSDPLTGFARIGGQMQLLPLDGTYGVQSIAYAINNSGQVVGTANIGYDHHGFVYASGVLTDLNNSVVANLHTDLNSASLINDAGQIVVHGLDGYDYLLTPNNPNTALSIASTHTGNFTQGQQNAVYTVTVSNDANAGASTGTVTVTENLPAGLTLVSMAGNGWSCPTLPTCTRGDSLSPGASYFPITVTVAVLPAATSPLLNQVTVSGGGSGKALGTDSTIVVNASSVIHFSVAPPATATAGSAISFTVTALDATNNTVGSYAGTVHFTSSDAQAVLPADSTLTSGSGAFSATFKTAGNQTLTATDNAVSSITGTSTGTVVSAAAASTTTVASNVPLTFSPSAQSITLNATVTSTSTVNNGSVAFTLLGTQVSADVTNGAASAGFTVSAGTAAGSYTIQAAYSPGTGFAASSDSTHQLQIAKATPSITWANPADISVGTGTAANNVTLTSVKVGSALATVLPQYIGTIGANASAQATVSVPGSVGLSGAASTLTAAGTYSGGTFSPSARITLP